MPNSEFSEFIRNASPEEKKRVYEEVMEKATEKQKEIMKMDKVNISSLSARDQKLVNDVAFRMMGFSKVVLEMLDDKEINEHIPSKIKDELDSLLFRNPDTDPFSPENDPALAQWINDHISSFPFLVRDPQTTTKQPS